MKKYVLSICENGYGKCTPIEDHFKSKLRGGVGSLAIKTTERNGDLVTMVAVDPEDEVMIYTRGGNVVRLDVSTIAVSARNTQGHKLVHKDILPVVGALVC